MDSSNLPVDDSPSIHYRMRHMELLKIELLVAAFFLVRTVLDTLTALKARRQRTGTQARVLVLDERSRVAHRLKQIEGASARRRHA